MKVFQLDPETHAGARARVVGREGRLSYARNPVYHRLQVWRWSLIIPSSHPAFDEAALSLEFAWDADVEFLDGLA